MIPTTRNYSYNAQLSSWLFFGLKFSNFFHDLCFISLKRIVFCKNKEPKNQTEVSIMVLILPTKQGLRRKTIIGVAACIFTNHLSQS